MAGQTEPGVETTATPVAAGNPYADSVRTLASAILRTGVLIGGLTGAACLAAATALAGWTGLAGAGVALTIGSVSGLLTVGLMRLAAPMPVEALLGVALGGYTLKIFGLLALAFPLRGVDLLDPLAFGLTLVAVVIAWAAAGVVAFRRTPILTVIPTSDQRPGPPRGRGGPA